MNIDGAVDRIMQYVAGSGGTLLRGWWRPLGEPPAGRFRTQTGVVRVFAEVGFSVDDGTTFASRGRLVTALGLERAEESTQTCDRVMALAACKVSREP